MKKCGNWSNGLVSKKTEHSILISFAVNIFFYWNLAIRTRELIILLKQYNEYKNIEIRIGNTNT